MGAAGDAGDAAAQTKGECHSLCFSMGDVPMRAEILEGCLVSHAAAVTPR